MTLKCLYCKSTEVGLYMGFQFGKYQCKKCGYVGVIVIEENEKAGREERRKSKNN